MATYPPLRFYVAARWDDREDALRIKQELEYHGMHVGSTWLTPDDNQSMDALKAKKDAVSQGRERAIKDIEEIRLCDVFLLYNPRKAFRNGTGGKHVETGVALSLGRPVFLYGERENVFHYHPMVRVVDSLAALLKALEIQPRAMEVIKHGGEGTTL